MQQDEKADSMLRDLCSSLSTQGLEPGRYVVQLLGPLPMRDGSISTAASFTVEPPASAKPTSESRQ
jgi:hypothetical protein